MYIRKPSRFKASIEFFIDAFFSVWLFMVGMGALHHDLSASIPSISLWQSFLIVFTFWQILPHDIFTIGHIRNMLERKFES